MKDKGSFGQGVFYGLSAYTLWGVLPIYWKSLGGIGALEILASRIIWSVVFVGFLLKLTGRWEAFLLETREIIGDRKKATAVFAAGITVMLNWGIFIWAVGAGHIIETSLGYYINPLVSVLLGVYFLKEKLDNWVRVAVLFAAIGVGSMIWKAGVFPWISISLAFSFGFYGLIKKMLAVETMTGIILETIVVSPLALAYVFYLAGRSQASWQHSDGLTLLLLAGAGIVTATPLLLFTAGAKLLPLTIVGFLQYLTPTLTLLLGVFLYGETFTASHLLSFAWIWLGLGIFSLSQLRRR
ncbi:MAG: EamA family transporter RarD [Acholeplasmataceae bacterium]|nr:EamA family transporter RarD [Acidaminococcaceae bacterium]NLY83742.1 EamA family transporter RarD [Acholeplasmataceae bacterium]